MMYPVIFSGNNMTPAPIFEDLFNLFEQSVPSINYQGFKTDVLETDKEYLIEAELAGIDKKDISINVEKGILTIGVQKAEQPKVQDTENKYLIRERMTSAISLERKMRLPNIDETNITAKMDNGVLKITLPKKEKTEIPAKSVVIE